ncbi:hypothetical protein [Lysobacter brunescens]|uniref:Uncharacterized protein n=1 Tax=Lysobacter brunescens TaxID=262323 RepID=A0ABW2YFG7_9GAMM
MAVAAYPTLLCTVLFALLSASPVAGSTAPSQASDATVLVDVDASIDGRWGRLSGNIALHAARPLATWQADLAVSGLRVGIARDASGMQADFDASGLVSSLARRLMPR